MIHADDVITIEDLKIEVDILNMVISGLKTDNANLKKDEELVINLLRQSGQELRICQKKLRECQERLIKS